MRSPVELFEHQFKRAAGEGAVVELKMRLLADRIPALQNAAYNKDLGDIETLIAAHFLDALTEDEKNTFTVCRRLRNKILHCDFRAARERLSQLGVTTRRGAVRVTDIHGLSGDEVIARIAGVKDNVAGTFDHVSDLPSAPGRVFAWLLEVGAAGDFVRAAECFTRAAAILDRLAMIP